MRKSVLSIAMIGLLGCATGSLADSLSDVYPNEAYPSPPAKQGGFYVGGATGYGVLNTGRYATSEPYISPIITGMNSSVSSGGVSATANMGYLFELARGFLVGPEVGYLYLPESREKTTYFKTRFIFDSDQNLKITYNDYAVDLLGVAKYYFSDNFNVFAKAGGAYVQQKFNLDHTDGFGKTIETGSKSTGKVLPVVGGGFGYKIRPNVELTVTYLHGFGDDLSSANLMGAGPQKAMSLVPSFNTGMIGLNFYF